MTEHALSVVAIAITDEFLTLLAADHADLGPADMTMAEWMMTLAPNFGAVAKAAAMADLEGDAGQLRAAAIRLGTDVLALVEQLDRESGRAGDLIGPPSSSPATTAAGEEPFEVPVEEPERDPVVRQVDFSGGAHGAGTGDGDLAYWNADRWRSHLRSFGVRVADALRTAQSFARNLGEPEPGTLDEIRTPALASALRGWVEQQATTA